MSCYTNTTGNNIDGWNISLFYSAAAQFFPVFHCALNDNDLESCMLAKNHDVATKTHEIFRY